jgi:hypothetical protein
MKGSPMSNNGDLMKKAFVIISIVIIIIGVGVTWGVLNYKVEEGYKKLNQVEQVSVIEDKEINKKVDGNTMAIVEIKGDIRYIKNGIDEIKQKLK